MLAADLRVDPDRLELDRLDPERLDDAEPERLDDEEPERLDDFEPERLDAALRDLPLEPSRPFDELRLRPGDSESESAGFNVASGSEYSRPLSYLGS